MAKQIAQWTLDKKTGFRPGAPGHCVVFFVKTPHSQGVSSPWSNKLSGMPDGMLTGNL